MRRIFVVGGSVLGAVILVLASSPSVSSYTDEQKGLSDLMHSVNDSQEILKISENSNWFPGYLIALLITYLKEFLFVGIVWILTLLHDILNP